jgi:aryl-alcohol dehydrogenase-like predicted oxidoreductase
MTAGQLAVLWVLNNALVTATIAGPRTEAQWDGYTAVPITVADEAPIDRLVPPGHPSTPGFSDPAYSIEGRVARTG